MEENHTTWKCRNPLEQSVITGGAGAHGISGLREIAGGLFFDEG